MIKSATQDKPQIVKHKVGAQKSKNLKSQWQDL